MDILLLFLDNPEKEYHIRELARITKNSPTTISTKLKHFQKEGVLLSKRERNHLLYRANPNNPNFRDLKFCNNLKLIRTSGIIAYLQEFFNQPSAIVLFGSFRKAENIPASDIDFF